MAISAVLGIAARAGAQDRFLGKQDILIYGYGLRAEPERQVVPKDIATIVSTFLQAPGAPQGDVPAFAPDAVLKATLRGPAVGNGLELTTRPNTPFTIPPLGVAGVHTLENIRLESGGDVLMWGVPESVTIEVIEKLLVTQVTARALSAQEIREKGIVFDKSNFQAYNFTAAFAIQDTPVRVNFPVVLPSLQGAQDVGVSTAGLGGIEVPKLPELRTIIPDTLKLQTQIPNLQVVGFTLQAPELQGKNFYVPPIPGVVVIPGDIGFLNQFFSVMLMVGNVAPEGSNLVVRELTGEILLPGGNDTVVGSDDDPLRMAQTTGGEAQRISVVVQAGADGRLGTADDVTTLGPGESGSAEYLVEGRREGSHVIEFNIRGTLLGLPVGPVPVTGRAAGAVAVRNPNFTLTFTHPDVVSAGEAYTLDVTVSNNSSSPANFVSVNLYGQYVSGAAVVGEPSRQIESIPPGDSATVTFDLLARVTGRVTAATLDSDENVQGRFSLKSAVGELGVPVSPDSLVLPTQARSLPGDLRNAALGLLGKAWAVATAPAAALPADVKRFSKQIVYDRAIEVAEAGFRVSLGDTLTASVAQLHMDFIGSNFGRLPQQNPDPADLAFAENDFDGFDRLRRSSVRGDAWSAAVARILVADLTAQGVSAFHRSFADQTAYRPAHLSVLVGGSPGPLPYTVSLVDAQGRRVGRQDQTGKVLKQIPYGDLLTMTDDAGATTAQMIVLAAPEPGEFRLQFDAVPGAALEAPFDVSLVVPTADGLARQIVYRALTAGASPSTPFSPADPYRVSLDLPVPAAPPAGVAAPASDTPIAPRPPRLISAVQQASADIISCTIDLSFGDEYVGTEDFKFEAGRVIAVLFDQQVTAASVQDRLAASSITNYLVEGNAVVGVALQPGGRIAFLALRDPVGPFVPRVVTVSGVEGVRGGPMPAATVPILATVTDAGALVRGQVRNADGTPVPFANVRLLVNPCGPTRANLRGISSKTADAEGRFSWDFAVRGFANRVLAVDTSTDDSRGVDFTSQRNGQLIDINLVMLGRGTLTGRTLAETGAPLGGVSVRVTSLTDQSQYAATSDALGRFTISRIPVGNVLIEAVSVVRDEQGRLVRNSKGRAAEAIPLAGSTTVRDVTLFDFIVPPVDVTYGTLTGFVLRGDGASPVFDAPVIAYYQSGSQARVGCPGGGAGECAVAVARTDASGAFQFENLAAGAYRLVAFDQPTYQQGEVRTSIPSNGTGRVNLLLSQGIASVQGVVLDADGRPVAGARVGGGLSLVTTDAAGAFTLPDVPVGRAEIVAVSDALGTRGSAFVDIVRAGQVADVTIVLEAVGSIGGTVYRTDGTTPVPANKVYVFYPGAGGSIQVVGTATTDAGGRYTFGRLPLRDDYTVSSFLPDFSDGNIRRVVLKFSNQVARADIVFRGGGGRVSGRVLAADGATPLRAAVSVSGDQLSIAGGLVGVGFVRVQNYQVAETSITTGTYSFSNIWVGPFTITAIGQFSPDPIAVPGTITAPNAATTLDLRLQETSRIAGTVFQPDGVTPVGRNVIVRYRSSATRAVCAANGPIVVNGVTVPVGTCADIPQGIQDETVITDDAGRFLVPLVNAGRFTLTAEDPATGRTSQVTGEVKPGQTGEFSIRLLGLSAVTIKVRGSDSTTPIPGARVEVQQLGFPAKFIMSLADASGTLVLDGRDAFSEGELVITATDLRPGFGFTGRASGRVSRDGENVTITVYLFNQSGTVFGTVFGSDGLTPVPNAEVVISNEQGALAFAVTDASGGYRQDFIPLGDFRVDVFEAATARMGFASGRIDLDRQEVPVDIVQLGRGLVTGTALEVGSLQPITNAEVTLQQTTLGGRALPLLQTNSDVDGTFSFPGTSVGAFRLTVVKTAFLPGDPTGFASSSASLAREGQRVDVPVLVQLRRPAFGRVEGQVFNADGSPGANVRVDLLGAGATTPSGAVAGPNGSFAIERVPVGRFSVNARSQVNASAASQFGELLFDGDLTRLTLTLTAVSQVSGSVVFANGQAAPNVEVTLSGQPSSGCGTLSCTAFTSGAGTFAFVDVPARSYTITARDPVSGLRGAAAGELTGGSSANVRVVLEPTGRVSGRVRFGNGQAAAGVTVDLVRGGPAAARFFTVTDASGAFAYAAVPIGSYTLGLEDPLGPGVATRLVQVTGDVALGDVTLDDAPPAIASVIPAASSTGVARNTVVRVVFTEPIDAATATQANISLIGPASTVLGTLQLSDNDTTVTFTPLAQLAADTPYALSIRNVRDRIGKTIVPVTASFRTVDITPPGVASLSPVAGGSGVPVASVIRVTFTEPIDVSRFQGTPVVVRKGGSVVAGRIDYLFGNTGIAFTPALPLDQDSQYEVRTLPAADLAGNVQPEGLSYSFTTTDRTPPTIVALVPDGAGTVIENADARVVAQLDAGDDVSVVDFYINDQPAAAARTRPFALTFRATPALGAPGARIKISALATDTSGNRSVDPVVAFVTVVADQPPALSITVPAAGASVRTGDRVTVTVRSTDDLGVAQIGYRAQTGRPQDAETRVITPVAVDRTETFAFNVPADAAPGSSISISASALDTKGQLTSASPVSVVVLDNTPPTVVITGTSTGTSVAPGQETSAVVSAQDLGGITSLTFTTGGVRVGTETRTVSPAQNAVATAFAFTVPAGARVGDVITLDASATDAAGNTTTAARVLLPVADRAGPTLTLRTSTGSLDIVPGGVVTVVGQADDETAVDRVVLSGQGAFSVSSSRQVSPPSNSTQVTFPITVPANAAVGSVLNLSATATDVFGNVSAPATLALTVASTIGVSLPPSVLVAAGEGAPLAVTLSAPAPAGGVRVDLAVDDIDVALVPLSVQFAENETTKTVAVTGVAGGVTTVRASVAGSERSSTTVTVRGGVVKGTVYNLQLEPVAGVEVVVLGASLVQTTVTDASGNFRVEGIGTDALPALDFTVKARNPVNEQIGAVSGRLSRRNGYAQVSVILLSAGSVGGRVVRPDGQTLVGPGVRVDLYAQADPFAPLETVFTDENSTFEFPVVTLGSFTLEASDTDGNRGRSTGVTISASGQHVDRTIGYLGRGSVVGTVRSASGNAQPNIPITFTSSSLFGSATPIQTNSLDDGTFRFDGVFVGTFTVQARDAVTNLAGTAAGSITEHQQVVTANVVLAAWGGLQGTVYRPDGVTPAPGAALSLRVGNAFFNATTDADGRYSFSFLPLGNYVLTVDDAAVNGLGRVTGTLSVNGEIKTQDVFQLGQGSVLVTVVDGAGVAVPGAQVTVSSVNGQVSDFVSALAGPDGTVLFERVLVGNLTIDARANGLGGNVQTTLVAGQVRAVTVTLQPTASIAGTVFRPDGQTPDGAARVAPCEQCGPTPVNPDGTYRFDGLPLGTWTVAAFDAEGRRRAVARNLRLTTNGQVVVADLTMIGVGTVTGRVLNPDNSSAPNLTVTLRSLDPTFGGFRVVVTDAAGFYTVSDVPVGPVVATAGNTGAGLLGEASGTLVGDGGTLGLDVLLKNNAVTLPVTLSDANLFRWDLGRAVSVTSGTGSVFAGNPPVSGGFNLDLIAGGTTTRFTGANIGTTEANGREVTVTQAGVAAGLTVTRKVLVSPTYFARYLELLSNPTTAPVTVDVRVQSVSSYIVGQGTTSSGDSVLDVSNPASPDRWATVNVGIDADPFLSGSGNTRPQLAFVFDGPGGAARVSNASLTTNSGTGVSEVSYTWSSITVPPGETVALMHFGVQQYSRAAAAASAERLVQLPPEALESLSPSEIAAIRNFAVPADLTSVVEPLPPLNGTVIGHVYEADGVTPVPSTTTGSGYVLRLVLRSSNVLFGRSYVSGADLSGAFGFGAAFPRGDLIEFLYAPVTIPIGPYTVRSTHIFSNVASPVVEGTFAPGATTSQTDLVYSNTAVLKGTVRRHTGVVVPGAFVGSQFPGGGATYFTSAGDGRYVAGGIPPGTATVSAGFNHPQRVGTVTITAALPVNVTAGQVLAQDLVLQPTGTVTGTVRTATGAVSVGRAVDLLVDVANTANRLRATTDSGGVYRFNDVPLGTFTVQTTDPTTAVLVKGIATVAQDQTSTVDLTYPGSGTVQVTVTYTTGAPAANARVDIQRTPLGTAFNLAGNTDANGQLSIPNVPAGGFILRVQRPGSVSVLTRIDVAGTMDAAIVSSTVVLPPVGSAQVSVVTTAGVPVADATVQSDYNSTTGVFANFVTDAAGNVTLTNVPGGKSFRVRAFDQSSYREVTAVIASEGQVLPITVVVGAVGTVRGRLFTAGGAPVAERSIVAVSASPEGGVAATTDADGFFAIGGLPTGVFRLVASDPQRGTAGSAFGRIAAHNDDVTLDVTMSDVYLPTTLLDANGSKYPIDTVGRTGGGTSTTDQGFATMFTLRTGLAGALSTNFSGDFSGAPDVGGRQLTIRDLGNSSATQRVISGTSLTMTRKVFVPQSGYFVRYLEVIDNPTAVPVTIDLQVSGSLMGNRVVTTSSGDAVLSAADSWMVVDHNTVATRPAVGMVLVGAGARVGVGSASSVISIGRVNPTIQWRNISVPAGGRAIVMHFAAQEPTSAGAQAAAQRLVQLPPEALEGLTAAEAEAIVNFNVPLDRSSALAGFGAISGQVFTADGVTPAVNTRVTVTGNAAPFFRASISVPTDAAARYRVATLAEGAVTVQAADAVSGVASAVASLTLAAGQASLTQDLVLAATGTLRGRVANPTGTPASSAVVTVTGGTPPVTLQPPVAGDGTYAIAAMPTGVFSVTFSAPSRVAVVVPNVSIVEGQTQTVDARFLAQASVQATVRKADGTVFPGVPVTLNAVGGARGPKTTDANGRVVFGVSDGTPGVLEGPFTLTARTADAVVIASVEGAVVPANDLGVVTVDVASTLGQIKGVVFAADGQTGLSGVPVQVFDLASNAQVASTTTGAGGAYELPVVPGIGGLGFRVVARSAFDGSVTAQQDGSFAGGLVQTVNLSLATAVLRGTVTLFDGVTPSAGASVVVYQTDANGVVRSQSATADAQGRYALGGLATGPFDAVALDGLNPALTQEASGTMPPATPSMTLDLRLPPSGTVVVEVYGDSPDGPFPLGGAETYIASSAGPVWAAAASALADGNGRVTFTHVPLGAFSVQACVNFGPQFFCGASTGTLPAAGDTATAFVLVEQPGEVLGTVVEADGVTPIPAASVTLVSGPDGPKGRNRQTLVADGAGRFSFFLVTAGPFTLAASDGATTVGAASGVLAGDGTVVLNVTRGSGVGCQQNLAGPAGFRYDPGCAAELRTGGDVGGQTAAAYQSAYRLRVNGATMGDQGAARAELSGRQFVYGPNPLANVLATRRVFVPASGRFARYLDTLENPGASAVQIEVQADSTLAGVVRVVTPAAATGLTYAITDAEPQTVAGGAVVRPTLAHVFAGPAAAVAAQSASFQRLSGGATVRWRLTIPAGGSVTLMHFAVQRAPGDGAGTEAVAQALAGLSDPEALEGMSAADRARVVNFLVP